MLRHLEAHTNYLPIPPYISLYLPISPYISLFHLEAHTDHRGAELLPSDVAVAVLIPLSEEVHHSASMPEQRLLELLSYGDAGVLVDVDGAQHLVGDIGRSRET